MIAIHLSISVIALLLLSYIWSHIGLDFLIKTALFFAAVFGFLLLGLLQQYTTPYLIATAMVFSMVAIKWSTDTVLDIVIKTTLFMLGFSGLYCGLLSGGLL